MHGNVFELSRIAIPASDWIRAGSLPDWFYEQVCDYAENLSLFQRKEAIGQFRSCFGNLCTQSGDMFIISPQIRETYFRKSYGRFKAAVDVLAQTDYEAFAGISDAGPLRQALDSLNDSYENKRGVYIYSTESGELATLDCWIRSADFSRPFYIGGTVNYHC